MAPTDVPGPTGTGPTATTAPQPSPGVSGDEALTADLRTRTPRVPTRVLGYAVGVLALLVLVAAVVALVVLRQPTLVPVPVPSASAIA